MTIGINYVGNSCKLDGCVNDSGEFEQLLLRPRVLGGFGCEPENIRIFRDDVPQNVPTRGAQLPTTQNILEGLAWLVDGVLSGDELFLHYSGHGCQQRLRRTAWTAWTRRSFRATRT